MPGKSKRKQMRIANKGVNTAQVQPAADDSTVKASPVPTAKVQTPYIKTSQSGSKAAAAQYTPELLEHVGSELRMTLLLSGVILVAIIVLYFVLR
jgi:hypothetical protein